MRGRGEGSTQKGLGSQVQCMGGVEGKAGEQPGDGGTSAAHGVLLGSVRVWQDQGGLMGSVEGGGKGF